MDLHIVMVTHHHFICTTFVVGLCMCMTMLASSSLGCRSSSRSFGQKVLSFVESVIEI